MTSNPIDEVQAKLGKVVAGVAPVEEVVITEDNEPVRRLVGCAEPRKRQLGTMKGTVTYMASIMTRRSDDSHNCL